jgi:hypothetical protein
VLQAERLLSTKYLLLEDLNLEEVKCRQHMLG